MVYFAADLLGIMSSMALGIIMAAKPNIAIELQRKFYARINWEIEPISTEKELRNTRIIRFYGFSAVLPSFLKTTNPSQKSQKISLYMPQETNYNKLIKRF